MYKNINVEAEHNELILENSHGDKVIIPANKRNWVQQKIREGCHDCIDSLVEILPIASNYAGDGTVIPKGKSVKVKQLDGSIKDYTTDSKEYADLYNSGHIASYDKNTDTYIAPPLKEITVTAEAPQWVKDKRKYESQYSKDWYIDNNMPKFSRAMGVSSDNMHPNSVKEYDNYINNKVVEDIFKRKPTFDNDYSNDRLKTLQGFSQKELELIKNSNYSSKIEPSIWSKFEQGLLSVGNVGSPVQFKNENLSQEEAKEENTPLNILQPLNIPSKIVQSTYKDNYSFKDALKGKQNNAAISEDLVTDPLNLVGLGIWSKLSKANKFAKIDDAYTAVKGLSKEKAIAKLTQEEAVKYRAERMLNQKNKWVGQDNEKLSEKFENAVDNHNPASDYDPLKLGRNTGNNTEVSKNAFISEKNKARVAAHETGHYYRNSANEANEWNSFFDLSKLSRKSSSYLEGNPIRAKKPNTEGMGLELSKGEIIAKGHGDELRERAAQIKDFIAEKNNIPLNENFIISEKDFDYALKNYVKETGLDNNMTEFITSIKDKKGLLKMINKSALSIAPATIYLQQKNENKLGQ